MLSPATLVLNKLLHGWFCYLPKRIGIRDHDLHALALEIEKVLVLTGLHLGIGPVACFLCRLDDQILVCL